MNKIDELIEHWDHDASGELAPERYRVCLPIEDAARIEALAELYPRRSREQIIADLLLAALDEVVARFPYVQGERMIARDEEGDPVFEDIGRTPQYLALVQKHLDEAGQRSRPSSGDEREMIQALALDHVVLRTTRMDEMLHFYSVVLGCELERELPPELGLKQLRAGSALIDLVDVDSELGRAGGGPPSGANNMDHFCLQIAPRDEEALLRYLQSQGVPAGEFERRYGAQGFGHSLYLRDPEGNVVELRNRL